MSHLPFAITPEAEACIEKTLIEAQRYPKLLALVPELFYASNHWFTPKSGDRGWYPPGQVAIGYHPREVVMGNLEYSEMQMAGFRIFIHKRTLELLRGKRIELEIRRGMAGADFLAVRNIVASERER
jgi:hypothetical protein